MRPTLFMIGLFLVSASLANAEALAAPIGKKRAAAAKSDCPPPVPGPAGPQGPKGDPGETKVVYVDRPAAAASPTPGFRLGIGYLGSAMSLPQKRYGWSHGLALQFQAWRDATTEITLIVGYAGFMDAFTWSPGKTRAWMFETGLTYWPWRRFGFMLGVHGQITGAKPDWERGTIIGIVPGLTSQSFSAGRKVRLRIELKPLIGLGNFDASSDDWGAAYGATAAGILSF